MMQNVYIHQTNIISPLGFSTAKNFMELCNGKTALQPTQFTEPIGSIFAGKIDKDIFQEHFSSLNSAFVGSTIEQYIVAALLPLIQHKGLSENTLFILSTTKGNIKALEQNNIQAAHLFETANHIKNYFGFSRKPIVVSNACVSGVMALSIAKRFIQMNQAKDAYVVAVDELLPFIISGFQSFQAMSNQRCKPYDETRNGVNLGEAAAAVYISTAKEDNSIEIAGDANINDANHISGPSRTGEGLVLSIEKAMQEAKITASMVDFVSLHGTATVYNDEMESIALQRTNLLDVPVNSFKGYYGHTLGASGLLETVLTIECMKHHVLLPSIGFEKIGVSHPIQVITEKKSKTIDVALKTASGFGGSNSVIVLKK